ncbi:ABC transporter substrate-binding protein [Actinospica durhamensis]|uniref:ABC transporter substrate-binding protein n=1 Tax=Actinospica durhamensis TaxID=1508375 RepID=A0A941IQ75_9ACTN|nr:ABC transporter substrate-binding protein [Actinospica durhamensis]MBR7832648.1 ABC transporter substrate-binding protein [Actinospica durhamensis]
MRRTTVVAAGAAIGLAATAALAGCSSTQHVGGSSGGSSTGASATGAHKPGGVVTISNEQGQTWSCAFNPFSPSYQLQSLGMIYEPLVYVDALDNQKETDMLATGYTWNADKTQITFTVRPGVTWSDGKPFTAADVAFTFNLLKQDPALDLYSLWSAAGLTSATASGNTAVLTFKQNAQTYFYNFADQVGIVPEHLWSEKSTFGGKSPDQWSDPTPVGTGPYEVNPCTANNIQYTANPHYWQPSEPAIQKVEYPAYLSNDPANNDLASGKDNWGNQFVPNIQSFYLSKSPSYHTWSPPVSNVALFPNLKQGATATLAVREAISYAIDRTKISDIGENGQEPPANQSGIITPTFSQYQDVANLQTSGYATTATSANTQKAESLLSGAGYSPAHPLNLTVISITGYTDWDADLAVMKSELAAIGINLTVDDETNGTYFSNLQNGTFQLAYYGETGGPTPYTELREELLSQNSAPIGQPASTNYERYSNPAVDSLLDQYATASAASQISIIQQVSDYMTKDLPIIPVVENVDWFQYDDQDIKGWPTASDPYAQPGPAIVPDMEQVLLHLYSASAQ